MNEKTLRTLEFHKVREILGTYCAFNASKEKALTLRPERKLQIARKRLDETSEARTLLEPSPEISIGGARDIRALAEGATRGKILTAGELLDVKYTLVAARTLKRLFEGQEIPYPNLCEIAYHLPEPMGLVDAITRTISERGDVLDSASPELGQIRSQLKITHDRLLAKMQKLLTSKRIEPYLQDALVTQRDGRYVIPLRADAKGRLKVVVHDVSSSGATIFAEPYSVVDMNNEWRELQVAERDEERRVLAEVSAEIGAYKPELLEAVAAIADLDLAFAKAKYAVDIDATPPILHPIRPQQNDPNPRVVINLHQARHPLLAPDEVVPIDVELDRNTYMMVITGPNTGGKTVTLKTVGLCAVMAQSGLQLPVAAGSEISMFKKIFADIGDEQSIEQSLSTFSAHIKNIIRILEGVNQHSLVIADELGSGTDPQEGAALAQAILSFLVERGVTTLVATHYPELKAYANGTKGVVNASVEFDLESLRPTYRLIVGLPGRSNALYIAQRLGLQDEIVDAARTGIDPTELRADDLLDEIHRERDRARTARGEAEKARRESDALRKELNQRLETIEDERIDVLNKAREAAQTEVDDLQAEISKTRAELARARQPLDALKEIEDQAEEIEDLVEEPIARDQVLEDDDYDDYRPIRLGDKVILRTLGQPGVVTALSEDDAEVQVGNLRIRARLYDLDHAKGPVTAPKPRIEPSIIPQVSTKSPGMELSVRRLTVDEALEKLDRYLDAAFLSGMPFVRIIHGKGTGKLRDAVRRELKGHPHVTHFETAQPHEGGDGATVAFLNR